MEIILPGIGVFADELANSFAEGLDLLGRRVVRNAEHRLPATELTHAEVVHGRGDHGGIRNRDEGVVECPDPRASEVDLLDGSLHLADDHPVPYGERAVEDHGKRAEEVSDRILGRHGDGDAADSESGQEAGDIDVQVGGDEDDPEGGDKNLRGLADQRDKEVVQLRHGRGGAAGEDFAQHVDESVGSPDPGEGCDELDRQPEDVRDLLREAEHFDAQPPQQGHGQQAERAHAGMGDLSVDLDFHVPLLEGTMRDGLKDLDADPVEDDAEHHDHQKADPLPEFQEQEILPHRIGYEGPDFLGDRSGFGLIHGLRSSGLRIPGGSLELGLRGVFRPLLGERRQRGGKDKRTDKEN